MHGRWWGPVWVLEELLFFKSLWWVPRPVVKPSKVWKNFLIKSLWLIPRPVVKPNTVLEEHLFFKNLWLDPWPVVNPSTGLDELLLFKSLWKNYMIKFLIMDMDEIQESLVELHNGLYDTGYGRGTRPALAAELVCELSFHRKTKSKPRVAH